MRYHLNYAQLFLLLITVLANSCNKSEKKQTPPHVNTFSATVNGLSFIPSGIEVLYGGSNIPGAKQVNVEASRGNGHSVVLVMLDYDGTLKTFTQTIGGYSIGPGLYQTSYSINGEIKIVAIDKTKYTDGEVVNGIFHFDTDSTVGTYDVSNGNFSVFVANN